MAGNALATVIKMFLVCYVTLILFAFFSHERVQSSVDNLVYDVAESVSTTGVLSENVYEGLVETIDRYSLGPLGQRYFVQLKLEKQIEPNVFDVFYESSLDHENSGVRSGKIVGRPLDVGDRITVYVQDNTTTLLGKALSMPLFTVSGGDESKLHIRSSQTAIVAKRMGSSVKGYDVIADLNTNSFTYVNKIVVITKVNTNGATYTVPTSLPNFKTYAVSDPSDPNYIFPDGEFLRSEDVVNGQRVVTYAQKY